MALLLEEFCSFPDDPDAARMGVEVAGLAEDSNFEPPDSEDRYDYSTQV